MSEKKARARLLRLAEAHPDWVLAFVDETWWSRLARPPLHTWAGAEGPLRLEQLQAEKDDPDPKALCCYGLLRADTDAIWLRFVVCALPTKSPWLNRIEPYWVHGKRAILKADRKLTAAETMERVCAYFGCGPFPPLAQQLN